MLRYLIYITCSLTFITSKAQEKNGISGRFLETLNKSDTVIFLPESADNYYNVKNINIPIVNSVFYIKSSFSYPHMYRVRLQRETDKIPYRNGFLFIDKSTKNIVIDSNESQSYSDGQTGKEFREVFIPFFLRKNEKYSIDRYVVNRGEEFDRKLLQYTLKYPDSYVALWFLINRFNNDGFSNAQSKVLASFSSTVKSGKLWQIVNKEFQDIKIREGIAFPKFTLQNTDLKKEILSLPKAKYTFIDYWFSRCAPCLAQLPYLQNIYNLYNKNGFNVIGIATDKTEHVKAFWQKRIIEKKILWKNYLDENGKEALSEKIYSYPTNFLLNKDGIVIKKNISLEDLAKFLAVELKNNEIRFYDPNKF